MVFTGVSYVAVLVAAVAGFVFGSAWYGVLGKQWRSAAGMTGPFKPNPVTFVIAFICQLVMAWMLAGLIGHMGEVTIGRSLITALFAWIGFVVTAMIVNHRFQSSPWSLTLIDGAHWLGVLLVMGVVIGLFGV